MAEEEDTNFDYKFKILMIGNSGVGKTSYLSMYFDDRFDSNYAATIGIDFRHKTFKRNGKRIQLQIWDTAGQERYQSITNAYFHTSMGVIVMFDLTDQESFEACRNWVIKATDYSPENVSILLLGNKVDKTEDRVVSTDEANELATELNIKYFETSAKENINIKESIDYLLDVISDRMPELLEKSIPAAEPQMTEKKKCKCPC